jgi:uncharacterized SAM-binding protein YcdF (DUF218 family)
VDRFKHSFIRFLKWFFGITGILFFLLLVLSFTDLPYYAYHWLGVTDCRLSREPTTIVVLGGSGMPSPDGLIRTFYAAAAAKKYDDAKIIIAFPANEDHSLDQLQLMANELIVKGVDSSRISFEPFGYNTHSQAVNIAAMYGEGKEVASLLLITSPEHMYRSVKTFRKAGFIYTGGIPAFEKPADALMIQDNDITDDTRVKSLAFRYNMWSYLHYELIVTREFVAIAYYKLKGWI